MFNDRQNFDQRVRKVLATEVVMERLQPALMEMVTVTEMATVSINIANQGSHGNSNAKQHTSEASAQRHWGNSIRVQWQRC